MGLICAKPTYSSKHLKQSPEVTIEHHRRSNTNFGTYNDWKLDPHQITPIYPQATYGTFPEPFRKIQQNLIPDILWNTYGDS